MLFLEFTSTLISVFAARAACASQLHELNSVDSIQLFILPFLHAIFTEGTSYRHVKISHFWLSHASIKFLLQLPLILQNGSCFAKSALSLFHSDRLLATRFALCLSLLIFVSNTFWGMLYFLALYQCMYFNNLLS